MFAFGIVLRILFRLDIKVQSLWARPRQQTCFQSLMIAHNHCRKKKMIQISSDGPNVNLSFLNLVRENRKDNNLQELLEIGTCGLHTVHCGLKHGGKASDWNIDKLLSAMYKIFDQSPSRRADYENHTDGNYPLQFCSHGWAENEIVAQRAALVWPSSLKTLLNI